MASSESGSVLKRSSRESARHADGENRDPTRPAEESTGSGQIEQRVALEPEVEFTESRPRTGLVRMLSSATSDSLEFNQAVEDLKAIIKESIQGAFEAICKEINPEFETVEAKFEPTDAKFEAFRTEMNAGFNALESQLTTLCWMMGAIITLLVAALAALVTLIVLVASIVYL